MRAAAIVLLLAACAAPADARPQDGAAERLAAAGRDLDSGDPKRVYAAVQSVVQLGGAALPQIEARAREAKGRVHDYLELAAEEIRSAPHLPGYPAVKRLSMKSSDKTVVELLADLRARTGTALSLENLMDEEKLPEIPFEVKDATMLEAFDAICHAGNVTVSMQNGQFMLYTGAYTDVPRFFYGHYLLRLGDFDLLKTVTFRKPATQGFNIQMDLVWDPAAAPLRFKPIRILEATDDRGKNLVPPPPVPAAKKDDDATDDGESGSPVLRLVPPSPGATKIVLVRGFATLVLPKSKQTVMFANPQVDLSSAAGDVQVKIVSVDAEHHEIRLALSSKKHAPAALAALHVRAQVGLKDWESTATYVDSPTWDEKSVEVRIRYEPMRLKDGLVRPPENGPPPPVEKLEVSIVTAVQDKRIPFEFRELKLR